MTGTPLAVVARCGLHRAGYVSLLSTHFAARVTFSGRELPPGVAGAGGDDPALLIWELQAVPGRAERAQVRRLLAQRVRIVGVDAAFRPMAHTSLIDSGLHGVVDVNSPASAFVNVATAVVAGKDWAVATEDPQLPRPRLSSREASVFRSYALGRSLDEVAIELGIASSSAKTYLDRARAKYAEVGRPIRSRIDIYLAALEDGLFSSEP